MMTRRTRRRVKKIGIEVLTCILCSQLKADFNKFPTYLLALYKKRAFVLSEEVEADPVS